MGFRLTNRDSDVRINLEIREMFSPMQLQAPAYQPRSVLKLVMVGVLAFTVAFSLSRLPLLSALFPHNAIAKPIAGYASLPLSFVANAGQTDAAVRFQVRAMGGTLYMGTDAITLLLPSSPTNTSKMAFTSQTLDQLPQPAPVRQSPPRRPASARCPARTSRGGPLRDGPPGFDSPGCSPA